MAKKNALGKGLKALIGSPPTLPPPSSGSDQEASSLDKQPSPGTADHNSVQTIDIEDITASSLQPRRHFSEDELQDLMESIRHHGIIQPLIVRKNAQSPLKFELIAGERRWRASRLLKLKTVPVILREANDQEVLEMALIENLQRQDLNPIEEALGYTRLVKEFQLKQGEIAQRVGKARASVANTMRLLDLENEVQLLVSNQKISMGHAKAILGLKEPDAQKQTAYRIIENGLTVRAAERLVQDIQKQNNAPRSLEKNTSSPEILSLQKKLAHYLSSPVLIKQKKKKGSIEISYLNEDDLKRLLKLLGL